MTLQSRWVCAGELLDEMEGLMYVFQYMVVAIHVYRKLIKKERMENDECRMCGSAIETLHQLISGCTVIVQYMDRHNAVRSHLGPYMKACADHGNMSDLPTPTIR